MPQPTKHKVRRIVSACVDEVWAIDPAKLDQICGFLDLRANGYTPTVGEIAQVMQDGDDLAEGVPQIIDGVQHMQIMGVMAPRMNLIMEFSGGTSTQQISAALDRAGQDPAVKSVVLEIDSPGGMVTGTEELRQAVRRLAATKRVVAVARGMMASAAYYVGSGATEVIGTPSSSIGSIGVYMIHREVSKAAEAAGVKFRVFRAGDVKAAGNPYEALTPEFAASLQARIDAPYRQFVNSVSENRGVSVQTVEEQFGQGQVFLADEAASRGLIDRVALFEAVVALEREVARSGASVIVRMTKAESDALYVTAAEAANLNEEELKMDPRIKAALVAKGLLPADATDEKAQDILTASFQARGESVPDNTDATVKAVLGWGEKPEPKPNPAPIPPKADDSQAAVMAERARVKDLRARGELLQISAEEIEVAIDSGLSVEKALSTWTEKMATDKPPVQTRIEGGEAEIDKVHESAVAVLANRVGVPGDLPPHARSMTRMSMVDIGRKFLTLSGQRIDGDAEADALQFLKLGGTDRQIFGSGVYAAEPSLNRPGDFPNLMSALAGKILDTAFSMAEVTYPMWCARMSDAADFKPRTIIASGVFDDLDLVMDDEMPKSLAFAEELMQWIQVDRYANKVGLTPVMMANDDLDAFNEQLKSLAYAHEAKINAMAVAQVATNPTMPDGIALFAGQTDNHYNLASSGTAISTTSLATMRTLHRLQPGVGTNKRIKTPMRILLCPPSGEEAALQTLAPLAQLEPKSPITDATINTFRGSVKPIVENDLVDHHAAYWYTLADPAVRRTIVYCFQRGYGSGGRRETWFENGRKTRYVALEGRFAVVAASWRGICKNPYAG